MKHNPTAIKLQVSTEPGGARLLRPRRGLVPLFLLLLLCVHRGFAGCDGFGGTGGACGTGGDVIYYTVTNGLVTITSVSGFNGQEVIFPTNGLPVVSIGPYAFYNSGVTNVIIPDTVTNIGNSAYSAFYNCQQLATITVAPLNPAFSSLDGVLFNKNQSVLVKFPQGKAGNYSIPGTVTMIRDEAFSDCPRLTDVTIPNSVTSIGYRTFNYCPSLTNVSLGTGLTNIGEGAFDGCYRLINLTLPNTLRSIGAMAFRGCASLTTISLPTSLTNIGGSAFSSCGLTAVTIPGSVKNIESGSFQFCDDLASLVIGNGVTHIGRWAFNECNVTNVTIPDSVTWIEYAAFGSCPKLATIALGRNLTTLEGGAFFGSSKLTAINVSSLNTTFSSLDGVLFNKNQTILLLYPRSKSGSYTIPASVTHLDFDAFNSCTGLTEVTIPNSVTNFAFYACTGLGRVTIENGATRIPSWAFNGCYSLTHLVIPDSVRTIESRGFSGCGLTNIVIPNGVITIGQAAFTGCSGLTSVTIGTGVTNIGDSAFWNCTSLTGVYMEGDAPSAGAGVFLNANLATIYYVPGATGWGPTFGDRPTALWSLLNPVILSRPPYFGVQNSAFGFRVSWAANIPVVVEACTNLAAPDWSPISTNTLASGWSYFSDPQWTNHPSRVYRVRSQ